MLFIILNLKQMRHLEEEAAADDAKTTEWAYTAVKDGEACWSKLEMFTAAADCTGDKAAAAAETPTGVSASADAK